jgi:indole-3-glycerol phosphate synthase
MLEKIIEQKKAEVAILQAGEIFKRLEDCEIGLKKGLFVESLIAEGRVSIIAEIKKKSPSLGLINGYFEALEIATTYEEAGVDAISVLTDEQFFGGKIGDLQAVCAGVGVPAMRKDFIISFEQIAQAALAGAGAVLLIVCLFENTDKLAEFIDFSSELGLDALVETHSEAEVEIAVEAGAEIVGVNARNLDSLTIESGLFKRVLPLIPEGIIKVAESGIETRLQVRELEGLCDGILVGSSLMKLDLAGMKRKINELLYD